MCNKRAVSTVTVKPKHEPSNDGDIFSINTVQPSDPTSDRWVVELEILMKKVLFRIDTGAKCNTLILHSPLKPVAVVSPKVCSSKTKTNAMFKILDIAQENVLSGTTAEALGLIVCLD